jgi:hypothetical protein
MTHWPPILQLAEWEMLTTAPSTSSLPEQIHVSKDCETNFITINNFLILTEQPT